jgi:hypothetical protein
MEETTMPTPSKVTLLDVVQAVSAYAKDDETVARIASLLKSGTVLLGRTFAGAKSDLPAPAYATPRPHLCPLHSLRGHLPSTPNTLPCYSFATEMGQQEVEEEAVGTALAVTQMLSKIPVTEVQR